MNKGVSPGRRGKVKRRAAVLILPLMLVSLSCSRGIPLIARGPHPATSLDTPVVVDSRPPPVKVQLVPPAPQSSCQWWDGEWVWRGNEWRWKEGSWITPVRDVYFADAVLVWLPTRSNPQGELFYTHSQWYASDGQRRDAPPPCLGP